MPSDGLATQAHRAQAGPPSPPPPQYTRPGQREQMYARMMNAEAQSSNLWEQRYWSRVWSQVDGKLAVRAATQDTVDLEYKIRKSMRGSTPAATNWVDDHRRSDGFF
eukprot:2044493-Pyramimonas_sp.AAC.1